LVDHQGIEGGNGFGSGHFGSTA